MGMAVILFNGAEPFEQIVNIPLTEGPIWNLAKTGRSFKDFIFYTFI